MAQKVANLSELKAVLGQVFQADKAAGVEAVFQMDLSGEVGGQFWILVNDGAYEMGEGLHDEASITLLANAEDFLKMVNGDIAPMQAFMSGKLKVKGDMGLALKFQSIFPTN